MGNNSSKKAPLAADSLMTIKQVADYLRFHPSTVYQLVRIGLIPARKYGRQWRVSQDDLHRWSNRGQEATYPLEESGRERA